MRIAFYAPLKPPDDPTPSGDRLIARLFLGALAMAGHTVEIASRLKTFDRTGVAPDAPPSEPSRHQRLQILADRIAKRLIRRWTLRAPEQRPKLWFTYHLYHKAPDWIGPQVAAAFGIPYVVAEASMTPRQAIGPWSSGHAAVLAALGRANLVLALNPKDITGVRLGVRPDTPVLPFKPFIDASPFLDAARHTSRRASGPMRLITVAMMRADVKRTSYLLLAQALARIEGRSWTLTVIGDGPAEPEIRAAFTPFGECVTFLGRLPRHRVAEALAAADLFVWPAIGEAIGMVFLEAQAAGLAVIGADRPGVAGVVAHGETGLLVPEGDAEALATAIAALIDDDARRATMAAAAAAKVAREHDLPVASQSLDALLKDVLS